MNKLTTAIASLFLLLGYSGLAQGDSEFQELQALAQSGDAHAQFKLGYMYAYGNGVTKDFVESVKWYTRAAKQGHPSAQHNLAGMYDRGNGVPQSHAEALKWFKLAGRNGNAVSQVNLGVMYEHGRVVDQNDATAAMWYWFAAEQREPVALNQLGVMHARGKYLPQNYVTAAMYFLLAIANGSEKALPNRKKVAGIISSEEYARAQEMAAEWLADHPSETPKVFSPYSGTVPDAPQELPSPGQVTSAFGISLKMTPFEVRLANGDPGLISPAPRPDRSTEYREMWVYFREASTGQFVEIVFSGDDLQSMTVAIVCKTGGEDYLLGVKEGDLESSVMTSLGYPGNIYWNDNEGRHLYYPDWGVSFETRNGRISQACIYDSKRTSFRT